MAANVSIWLRAFRLPLQRAYPRLDTTVEDIEADFDDLLRAADERLAEHDLFTDEDDPPPKRRMS